MERLARKPPRDIAALRERVERWRQTRASFGPMPAELWTEAEVVARRRGLYATARGVGIDYGTLAKRLNSQPERSGRTEEVAFVEWSGAEVLGRAPASGTVVEMSDGSGRQMTIRVDGAGPVDLAGIVAAFCGPRP